MTAPEIVGGVTRAPRPAKGHMPFEGHRTQKEVREHEERISITRRLGR